MDRFLDDASPERKARAKEIQTELNASRQRIQQLTQGKVSRIRILRFLPKPVLNAGLPCLVRPLRGQPRRLLILPDRERRIRVPRSRRRPQALPPARKRNRGGGARGAARTHHLAKDAIRGRLAGRPTCGVRAHERVHPSRVVAELWALLHLPAVAA